MINLKVKVENIDPTGVVVNTSKLSIMTPDVQKYSEDCPCKNFILLYVGECVYKIDNNGVIIDKIQ